MWGRSEQKRIKGEERDPTFARIDHELYCL